MASVTAVMVCDYFLLTRGNLFLSHLYDGDKENRHYYYTRGWNLQALLAYVVGIALPFPGFVGTLGPSVSVPAQRLGHLGWLLSFVTSFVVYYALCLVWPTRNQKIVKELGLGFEEMSYRDVVAADGTVVPDSIEGKMADGVEVLSGGFDGQSGNGVGNGEKKIAYREDERSV